MNAYHSIVMGVIITVLFGMFCAAMEALITATILPTIISNLGGMELYPWIVNSFLLCFIVVTPIFGKMSDTYGYKKVYLVAVTLFLVSSILCGSAQNMMQLIIFRGLQGIGTGGLITMSIIFFGEIFPLDQRAKMQALLSSMWAIASLLGPAIGAYLVHVLSWRWAFYINVPSAIIIFVSISLLAESKKGKQAHERIDKRGLVYFILGCFTLVYGLVGISRFELKADTLLSLFASLGLMTIFFRHSKRTRHSLIPFGLFKRHEVVLSAILGCFCGFFLFCIANFLPMYVQGYMGKTVEFAGKIVTSIALGSFSGAIFCGLLLNRIGFRFVATVGAVGIIVGFSLLTMMGNTPGFWRLAMSGSLIGLGISSIANASIIAAQAASPKKMIGSATALFHFARSFGGLVGIASMGGVQLGIFNRELAKLISRSPENSDLVELGRSPQQIFNPLMRAEWSTEKLQSLSSILGTSMHVVFCFCLAMGVLAIFVTVRMPRKKPTDYAIIEDPIPLEE